MRNTKLHIVKLTAGVAVGPCGVCYRDGQYKHWDADLRAPICPDCAPHVKAGECELLHAKLEQPER